MPILSSKMPRRSRSATPEGERRRARSRSRSRSRSRERSYKLPEGVSEISESDYFLKSDEFRIWLKDEKDRASRSRATRLLGLVLTGRETQYMDELSSEKSRRWVWKCIVVLLGFLIHYVVTGTSGSSSRSVLWRIQNQSVRSNGFLHTQGVEQRKALKYVRPHRWYPRYAAQSLETRVPY